MPDLFVAPKNHKDEKNSPSSKEQRDVSKRKNGHHTGAISVFSEFPENIQFENQEDGEIIQLFLRRHFITNLHWILITILLSLFPFLFLLLFLPAIETIGIIIPPNFQFILLLLYYLMLVGYAFTSYVSWFYNVGMVTNLRVVDIDVEDITRKNVAATEMEDLIDVDYRQQGFLQNFFDYGHVHIQIEGIKPNFEFLSVPHPAKVADVISDLMREVQHRI